MQFSREGILCETGCRFFRCSERFMKIAWRSNRKIIQCEMVEGDECIGYKCKFAVCGFRPPALEIDTGICLEKKKNSEPKRVSQKHGSDDDPLRYRNLLDKKMRKGFKIKDYY